MLHQVDYGTEVCLNEKKKKNYFSTKSYVVGTQ